MYRRVLYIAVIQLLVCSGYACNRHSKVVLVNRCKKLLLQVVASPLLVKAYQLALAGESQYKLDRLAVTLLVSHFFCWITPIVPNSRNMSVHCQQHSTCTASI